MLGSSLSELSVWVQARKVVFDEVQSFAKGKVAAGQELTVAEISQLQSSLRKRLLATEVSLRTTQFRGWAELGFCGSVHGMRGPQLLPQCADSYLARS